MDQHSQMDNTPSMQQQTLPDLPPPEPSATVQQMIESILFVASEPVTIAQLARVLELPADTVEQGLTELTAACRERGIRVLRHGDNVQLVTAPQAAPVVARFLGTQTSTRLSNAALEVLAIIAYRQPLTRAQVEAVRGVDSSGVIRILLARNLITEVGRLETVGRPIIYATTPEFLRQFGLTGLDSLPPLTVELEPNRSDDPHVRVPINDTTV